MPDVTDRDMADQLVLAGVRLVRTLRALDTRPRLTPTEASALAVLVHGGAMGLGTLAMHEGVRPPSMTRTVGVLEARGYVRRAPDPNDGRGVVLSVTPEGRRVFRAGHRRLMAPLIRHLHALPPDARRRLEQALPTLLELPARLLDPPP